jgi:AAA+ superfamily predicted ATPase
VGEALFGTLRQSVRDARQLREADAYTRLTFGQTAKPTATGADAAPDFEHFLDDDEVPGYLAAREVYHRGVPTPAQIAVKIQLARMLDASPGLTRQIRYGTPVVIVAVSGRPTYDIVRDVWTEVLLPRGWSHIVASNLKRPQHLPATAIIFAQSPQRRDPDDADVVRRVIHAVQSAVPVLALTHQGARPLPDELVQVSTHSLTLPPLDGRAIDWTIRIVTGAKPPSRITPAQAARLTLDDLSLHVRHDKRAEDCLKGLNRAAERRTQVRRPRDLTLDELHGMGEAVAWARSTLVDLSECSRGRIPWHEVDHSIALEGPPGTGKNLFAKVFSEEAGLPLIHASLARWQSAGEGHLGHLLRAMRGDFEKARESDGCVMFFDEIDAFPNRDEVKHSHKDYVVEVVNGFLEQLDGFADRRGIIFLAASNNLARCDPAILRAGRFNRIIRIGLPTPGELERMFRIRLRGALDAEDLAPLAELALQFTGADVERAVRDARRRARHEDRELTLRDLELAIVGDAQELERRERWCACVHEAGHALMMSLLNGPGGVRAVVGRTSNVPGHTRRGGGTILFEVDFENVILEAMAGRAAEALVLGAPTAGAGGSSDSDLAAATRLAAGMCGAFGLAGPHPLVHIAPPEDAGDILRHRYMRVAVQQLLERLYDSALEILRPRMACLTLTAIVLHEAGRVSGRDVAEIARRTGAGEIASDGVRDWRELLRHSGEADVMRPTAENPGGDDEKT